MDIAHGPGLSILKDRYIDPSIDATAIAVDPVQGSMAVGHANGQIKLFARKYPSSSKVCTLNRTPVVHLAFIPDQAALAAIDEQGYLWVFDTDTLQLCFSYKVPSVPTAIALIAGTSWLALGTEIGRVYFVDVVNSRKSDFSIGCQVQPPSHVASVEPHPVETERLLVAYSGGGCVVCDIGKASLSEKAMVVARYTFEHPDNLKQEFNHTDATPRIIEPQLTGAGWSPSGEHIAAVYDNGILCVFSANTASRPVVARTIAHPDIFSAEDAAATSADLERGMRCLGHVRWCTHSHTDQSFLVVTSGSTVTYQQAIHIFSTGCKSASIKNSTDVIAHEKYELESPMTSLCTIPHASPWRNGNEGLAGLLVLMGQPSAVHDFRLDAKLHLARSASLNGELSWCATPTVIAQGAKGAPSIPFSEQAAETAAAVTNLLCCVDSNDTFAFWGLCAQELKSCTGVHMNCQYLSRLLGIEGKVSALDFYASNGLLVIGMSSGEALFCVVTQDSDVSLAQRHMPIEEIRELASIYYLDAEVINEQALEDQQRALQAPQGTDIGSVDNAPPDGPDIRISSEESTHRNASRLTRLMSAPTNSASRLSSDQARDRSDSVRASKAHSLHLRRSRPPSSVFGSLLRKGSLLIGRADNGDDGAEQDEEGLVSGSQNKADDTGDIRPAARLLDIDREIWSSRRSRINGELANRIYGLKFSAPERKRINDSGRPSNYHKQDLMSDVSEPTDDGTQQQPKHSPPSIIPFILARFYCREVVQVVAGHDGIAAIIYEGGVFAIVDCVGQSTLLVDNLNQSPEKTQTAKDVFTAAIAPPQLDVENAPAEQAAKAAFSKEVETITAANIVRFSKPSLGDGSAAGEKNADAASEDHFAVGTSRGYVSLYPIFGSSPPQTQAWPCTGPILYLEMETIACSSAKEESKGTPPHMLVVGTHTAVTVHDGFTPTPVFRHTSPKNTHFLGMRIVKLQTGWHGVAAVDAQANVTLLSLPELREECVLPIPGAKEVIASVNIGISADGHISLLGPNALLIQASIAEAAGTPADKEKRSFFDASLESPQRPVRKGITSWLFGKTSSSSQDIDSFFHEHFRDLLAGGGTCPGAHLRQTEAPPSLSSAPGPSSEPSKAAEIDRSIDPSGFSEARSMLDKREERLGDIDQKVQAMSLQASSFLDEIRAYNAKQERSKKKRFGLF